MRRDLARYLAEQRRYHNNEEDGAVVLRGIKRERSERENSASAFHDGKGIHYVVAFRAQLPPLQPNERRRKNAPLPVTNCSVYVHESSSLAQVLDAALNSSIATTLHSKLLAKNFVPPNSPSYTLSPRSSLKNMNLTSTDDLKSLLEAATAKGKPEAKLEIAENPIPEPHNENDKGSRKRKLPPEEEELAETVTQLRGENRCSDKNCSSQYWFVGNAHRSPCPLDPRPSQCLGGGYRNITISSYIYVANLSQVAKMPGVDVKNPPPPEEQKMFWPDYQQLDDADDISLLARRRCSFEQVSNLPYGQYPE
ncbi:hypothetical protein R3P38DRAFT_3245652 [Favolaschia claudopus]|uniref:Uncharacterized protein n=1 Tax=Favolaschia claudopus TaxID=2862362 RepID=A0AAV9Z0I9_9AGAR